MFPHIKCSVFIDSGSLKIEIKMANSYAILLLGVVSTSYIMTPISIIKNNNNVYEKKKM